MDKKAKLTAGLFFGITMAAFGIVQNLMTHDNLTAKSIAGFVLLSIISGVVQGFVFAFLLGWLAGLFMNSKAVKQAAKIDLQENEIILFETGANHFKGAEGVGGKLYLTSQRLVFRSHKFNIQNHEWSVNINSILHIDQYKTLGVVNNGLSVTTPESTEKFVVQQLQEWFTRLSNPADLQPV